jgi:hypothetical protein
MRCIKLLLTRDILNGYCLAASLIVRLIRVVAVRDRHIRVVAVRDRHIRVVAVRDRHRV